MNSKYTRILLLAPLLTALGAGPALSQVIYDSTVSPQPGNLPSVGAEAYAFKELGDSITFVGTARSPKTATVTMSSWACQSGAWNTADCVTTLGATAPILITLKIYSTGSPTPGALIASVAQTFSIPYRPSANSVKCTAIGTDSNGGNDSGKWYNAADNTCYNGFASNVTFDLSSLSGTLPNNVVYGLSYNTTHYGAAPIGESALCFTASGGCFYDSLNIALAPMVNVGTQAFSGTVYQKSDFGSRYCDSGIAGTGTFRLDSPTNQCWIGYVPAVQFTAYTKATSVGACKNGGWQSVARAGGSPFKNQGDCIQYVNTGK